jgi:UDP-N-acetylmuramate--alanine ligase
MLHGRGYRVSGSDMHTSETTADLAALGITVQIGHDAAHVVGADLVVATAAARDTNPEIAAARAAGIPLLKRAALLGMLANPRQCLAVAGSHGKSTTSGMATLALERAGVDPAFAIGATVRELGQNARDGGGPHFVVEADEYDYSFLWLRPQVAIITNIEFDHPDLFADRAAVLHAFKRFIAGIDPRRHTGTQRRRSWLPRSAGSA